MLKASFVGSSEKQTPVEFPSEYLSQVRQETIPKIGFLVSDLCYAKNIVEKFVGNYVKGLLSSEFIIVEKHSVFKTR